MDSTLRDDILNALRQFPQDKPYTYWIIGGAVAHILIEKYFDVDHPVKDIDIDLRSKSPEFHRQRKEWWDAPCTDDHSFREVYYQVRQDITLDFANWLQSMLPDRIVSIDWIGKGVPNIIIDSYPIIDVFANNDLDQTPTVMIDGLNLVAFSHYFDHNMITMYEDIEDDPNEQDKARRLEERIYYMRKIEDILTDHCSSFSTQDRILQGFYD